MNLTLAVKIWSDRGRVLVRRSFSVYCKIRGSFWCGFVLDSVIRRPTRNHCGTRRVCVYSPILSIPRWIFCVATSSTSVRFLSPSATVSGEKASFVKRAFCISHVATRRLPSAALASLTVCTIVDSNCPVVHTCHCRR